MYIIVIIGTITVENLVICFNPPYIIINVIIERTVAIKKTSMLVFTKLLVIVLDCIPQKIQHNLRLLILHIYFQAFYFLIPSLYNN